MNGKNVVKNTVVGTNMAAMNAAIRSLAMVQRGLQTIFASISSPISPVPMK
jgi:hypothetical protein